MSQLQSELNFEITSVLLFWTETHTIHPIFYLLLIPKLHRRCTPSLTKYPIRRYGEHLITV